MGNQKSSAQLVAIIRDSSKKISGQSDQKKIFEIQEDYNRFFRDPDRILCKSYENFDEFIQKQSLKHLRNIVIIETNENEQKSTNGSNQLKRSYIKSKQDTISSLPQYMIPIYKVLQSDKFKSMKITPRQKLINYVKKYSLQYLNIFIYVANLNQFVIPQSQLPYITMISTSSDKIMNHILNEQKQQVSNTKFKRLVKDLYRRKLVIVLSKDYHPIKKHKKDLSKQRTSIANDIKNNQISKLHNQIPSPSKSAHKSPPKHQHQSYKTVNQNKARDLIKMQQVFKYPQNSFSYLFLNSIQQLWQKIKSVQPQFLICMDKQNLLELIQFKRSMSFQSKLIYFGKQSHLFQENTDQKSKQQMKKKDKVYQKKMKQIWWVSDQIQEISRVMKKWWYSNKQNQNYDKTASNVVIYLTKCQNIIKSNQILQKIKSKMHDKLGNSLAQNINITVQTQSKSLLTRLSEDLYTIVIMLDGTYDQLQQMKKIVSIKLKAEHRIQITLIQEQLKETQNQHRSDQLFQFRLEKATQKSIFQFKFQTSPIQSITCINLQPDVHDFFENKIGLNVKKISTNLDQNQQVEGISSYNKGYQSNKLQHYFPKLIPIRNQNSSYQQQKNRKQDFRFELPNIFDNFYIVCNLQTYQKELFPYLSLLNYYHRQKKRIQLPQQNLLNRIKNYLKKIKIIIYQEIILDKNNKQFKLNKLLSLHLSKSQYKDYIISLINNYLNHLEQLEQYANIKKNKTKKGTTHQIPLEKQLDRVTKQYLLYQEVIKILIQLNGQTINNANIQQLKQKVSNMKLPNVQFVHYRLGDIQQYLNFCKYTKLSFPFFPKGSLKKFFENHRKIQSFAQSRSFFLQATFISNNQLLKKVFQQKNIEVSSKYQMQFIRFTLNKINQVSFFKDYIKSYSNLWKLKFELTNQKLQLIPQNFDALKLDIIKCFRRCRQYQLLKISPSEFEHFYLEKIEKCETLLDLQIAAIYIYSLPHGVSDIINSIFSQPFRTNLSLEIFSGYILTLFINFYSFEINKLQKISTVIYIEDSRFIKTFESFRQSQIIYNKNILHLLNNQNQLQNQKNNCIFIDYQNIPLRNKSNICPLLKIQRFSFYKESAEYLMAPFTKMRLVKKQIIKGKYKIYFQIIQQDINSNIFLDQIFKLNKINQIALFKNINENLFDKDQNQQQGRIQQQVPLKVQQQKQKQKKGEVLKILLNQQNNQSRHNKNQNKLKFNDKQFALTLTNKVYKAKQQKQSLYRQAQQVALEQQKSNVKVSIEISLKYMKFFEALKLNKLFTCEKYFYQLYKSIQSSLHNNQKAQKEKQQIQIQKLHIQKAMIFTKTHQYTKALNQLKILKDFIKYQKIQDKDGWINEKINEQQQKIKKIIQIRQNEISKIQPQKNWAIDMEEQDEQEDELNAFRNIGSDVLADRNYNQNQIGINIIYKSLFQQSHLNSKIVTPPIKWRVKYTSDKQSFIMENLSHPKQKQHDVFQQLQTDKKQSNSAERGQQHPEEALGTLSLTQLETDLQRKVSHMIKGKGQYIRKYISTFKQDFLKNLSSKTNNLLKRLIRFKIFKKKIKQKKLQIIPSTQFLKKFIQFQNEQILKKIQKNHKSEELFNILPVITKKQQTNKGNIKEKKDLLKQIDKIQLDQGKLNKIIIQFQQLAKIITQQKDRKNKKRVSKQMISNQQNQVSRTPINTILQSKTIPIPAPYSNENTLNSILSLVKPEPSTRNQQKLGNSTNKEQKQNTIRDNKEQNWRQKALKLQSLQTLKWSVFQFGNQLKIVQNNKKFKQKMKSNKKNPVFYRNQANQLLKLNAKQVTQKKLREELTKK